MILSHSSRKPVDPVSQILLLLGARCASQTRLEASGDWAISFDRHEPRIKIVAVLRGECWLTMPGVTPQRLKHGDMFLMGTSPYVVASNLDIEPIDGMPLYADPGCNVVRFGGDETVLMGVTITFASAAETRFLFDVLPGFLRFDTLSGSASTVARTLELLDFELGRDHIGGMLVTSRLAEILFIEALRAYAAQQGDMGVGWFGALADRRIGEALRAIHGRVEYPWTVSSLAAQSGMSRSAFSARFCERVGRPPLEYLTFWRMLVARRLLQDTRADIGEVSRQVGYRSQSAFAHAFKRAFGHTPRQRQALN